MISIMFGHGIDLNLDYNVQSVTIREGLNFSWCAGPLLDLTRNWKRNCPTQKWKPVSQLPIHDLVK